MDQQSTKQMKASAEADAILEESIINVKTVASCNGQETMIQKYKKLLQNAKIHALKGYAYSGFFDGLFYFLMYLFIGIGFL